MRNKKGSLNLMVPAIIILTVGAAALTLGLIILDEMGDVAAEYTTTINFSQLLMRLLSTPYYTIVTVRLMVIRLYSDVLTLSWPRSMVSLV